LNRKTRIGIIGLGGIGQLVHLPTFSKLKEIEIAAVAELNKNRLNSLSDKFNIPNRFTDYREMLANVELDAVVIATPTNTHLDIALDCLSYGRHLLIEKPVTRTFEESLKIKAAAEKNNCQVMVGMNARFRPDSMLLKSLISSGELGEIFYIRCGWSRNQSSAEKWFSKKSESGGGVTLDLGIVLLDLSIWLFDYPPIKSISVQNYHHRTQGVEDSSVGLIKFQNSSVINFEFSWALHSIKDSFELTAYGTKGTAQLNPLRVYRREGSTIIDYTPSSAANSKNLFRKSYENEIKHFIASIRNEQEFLSPLKEAITRMQIIEGIYKSAESGNEIKFG